MKKITIGLLILFFGFFKLYSQTAVTPSGSGTDEDPYLIASLENLFWIGQNQSSWSSYFVQTEDIDASSTVSWNSGEGWEPISPFVSQMGPYFMGFYNGGGHSISGLTINRPTLSTGVGLFGVIVNSSIQNLSVTNVNITGGHGIVAGIAGLAAGACIIKNCMVSGTITGVEVSDSDVGKGVGGIIGQSIYFNNTHLFISDCYSTATVSSNYKYVGGIIGNNQGKIYNCYATGNITSSYASDQNEACVGGLVGTNQGEIIKCYASGKVSGYNCIGGLVGKNTNEASLFSSAEIDSCYATGRVTVIGNSQYTRAGGLVGTNYRLSNINHCYATGNIEGNLSSTHIGGLVGKNEDNSNINFCFATGSVNGKEDLGGLVGHNNNTSKVSNCYARGNVNGQANNVGGLIGNNDSEIITSYSTGTVFSSGGVYGGFAGTNSMTAVLADCFWDIQTSGLTTGCGYNESNFNAIGKTTSEMKTQSTFTNAGWNFLDIWQINNMINDGYPSFKGMITGLFDHKIEKIVNIYPNPVEKGFFLSTDLIINNISIYDIRGAKVLDIVNYNNYVDVSNLPKGIYIVQLHTKEKIYNEKLIKK